MVLGLETFSHEQVLYGSLVLELVWTVCYLISAMFLASNAYAGFNVLVLGILQLAVIALSYYGFYMEVTRTLYGIVLGAVTMLVFQSLQSAVFWGQYAACESYHTWDEKAHYGVECHHRPAMKSVCVFSVFLFLTYAVQLGAMIRYKNDILGAAPANESVGNRDGIPTFAALQMRAAPLGYTPVPYSAPPPRPASATQTQHVIQQQHQDLEMADHSG